MIYLNKYLFFDKIQITISSIFPFFSFSSSWEILKDCLNIVEFFLYFFYNILLLFVVITLMILILLIFFAVVVFYSIQADLVATTLLIIILYKKYIYSAYENIILKLRVVHFYH